MSQTGTHFSRVTDQVVFFTTRCLPYVLIVTVVLLIWKILRNEQSHRPRHLREPPGPIGLPIIGNVLQLGPNPCVASMRLAKKFGNVIKVKIGTRTVIVLNGKHAIQQASLRQSVDFAGRPDFMGFRKLASLCGELLSFSNYDDGWKLHRKTAETAFRHFTSGRRVSQFEHQVKYEVNELIQFILGKNKTAVTKASTLLRLSVSNVIVNALFQVRHDLDNPVLEEFVTRWDLLIKEITGGNIIDFMPWMKPFLASKVKAFDTYAESFMALLKAHIKEHNENYEKGMDSDIYYYLKTLVNNMDTKQREQITEKRIFATVYDFFGAGLDVVAGTLDWAFLYAIYYPDLQVKVQAEIDHVVGRDRLPTLADRDKLPFTQAFLAETCRHSSVVSSTIPHTTTRDTVLEGGFNYFIPKDTVVFLNLYSIHQDPDQWGNPDVFDPTRFLTDHGSKVDTTKIESLMIFGGGRRKCVGFDVAQIELFLFFSIMLHQCHLRNPAGQTLSIERKVSMGNVKVPPYKIEVTRRCLI